MNDRYYEGVRDVYTMFGLSISEPDHLFLSDLFTLGKISGAKKSNRFLMTPTTFSFIFICGFTGSTGCAGTCTLRSNGVPLTRYTMSRESR
jgi:hypothetical protein